VDAGPMQIQWCEGAELSRAETVLQGTTHDTLGTEMGHSFHWLKSVLILLGGMAPKL
jgi:hypothetical protein